MIAAPYDARIADAEILTPIPADAPRINGPALYGAQPGKKFIYRIPTQGKRPIQFEVENLPVGLKLDAAQGILTGVTPDAMADYVMRITARNDHGTATRDFKLVVGNKLALTPPVGWNSWGAYMLMVTDEKMRMTADLLVKHGLADVGFQYVSIDDAWMRISPEMFAGRKPLARHEGFDFTGMIGKVRDEDGNILPNAHFPDMKGMVEHIHSYGLKAGLYSSPGPQTCQNFGGSFGHELRDAKQYAAWGFDFIKYDQCSAYKTLDVIKKQKNYDFIDFWRPMVFALRQQDRDIVYNLCEYGDSKPWTWAPGLNMQTWRTGGDLNHNVRGYFREAMRIATELRDFSQPGQWNDPDYMYIHKIRSHKKMVAPAVEIPLNTNQRYQYVTLWSMICAPFFFSCDMDEIDEFTFRLLGNADVVGINQDELGKVARVVEQSDKRVVMVKSMVDGSRAVALFNRDDKEARIALKTDWLGSNQTGKVLDVWRQKKVDNLKAGDEVLLSPHGVALFIVGK
ncbi:MAG: alpha-galactosidase [Verrucomicrobiae bacterium]|nr:alpha-galactosidase [Verrucomicrobiae bacterium]